MTESKSDELPVMALYKKLTGPGWGLRLFLLTLVVIAIFFWWLLIWSGGVDPHHG